MAIAGASSSFALSRSRFSDFLSVSAPKIFLFQSSKIGSDLPSIRHGFLGFRIAFSPRKKIVHASVDGVDSVGSTSLMKALKDLGLDVAKGTVTTEGSAKQTKFFITRLDTGRKVEDPDLLESIRLTIINNLLKYHPESSERLAMGEAFGIKAPEKKLDVDIATHVQVKDDGPKRSLLYIETADRPGLLLEIIKIMADININVESAEIDTEGLVAKDKFHVSYRGAALNSSLSQVLTNCLRYYLRRPETDEDSY
ncbi:ACT domain-containing protein ACR12 isoform X3 [Camellia sinensis]|uniref:ACT domain-containing protein ACR12 isoform X3 n=1 Tax=Camellia sinensis TaxID=4442 RepID=UPI001036D42D|nr:ACT domain-containing protein ACR12 isoform X3 [Camellia sinensis]